MHPSPFVWYDSEGADLVSHAYFRREFQLTDEPQSAQINLYADTYYHAFVNGHFVGYGPIRGYADLPQFDTIEIAPYLTAGRNVVAVHVYYIGVPTFHNLPNRGGFCAWGVIGDGSQAVDLTTATGWVAAKANGFDPLAISYSFAQAPIQIYDERKDIPGWNGLDRPDGPWVAAVPLAKQESWGTLTPRSIATLTNDEILPLALLGMYPHKDNEEIVSFRVRQHPDLSTGVYPQTRTFAFTYVYSDRQQQVRVGSWWNEMALNGKWLKPEPTLPDQQLREDVIWNLEPGWNPLVLSYGMVEGTWELHLALPKSAGIVLSSDRDPAVRNSFLVSNPISSKDGRTVIERAAPRAAEEVPEVAVQWHTVYSEPIAVSPQRTLAWANFTTKAPVSASKVSDFTIPANKPTSIVVDMGAIVLGRVFIEFDAPAGTVFDTHYSESLRGDKPDPYRHVIAHPSDRQISAGGSGRMETFLPRGFRYLQLGVHNHDSEVVVKRIGVMSQIYPYVKVGSFECSDPFFNTIWQYGWNSLRLCSEDAITDCPSRERTLYGGDLLPEAATTFAVGDRKDLVRRCLQMLMQSQSPETGGLHSIAPSPRTGAGLGDYPLITIILTDWYCRISGDQEFAAFAVPVFRRLIAQVEGYLNPQGLVELPGEVFIEWLAIDRKGAVCAVNSYAARAYAAFAALLRRTGFDGDAVEMERKGLELADRVSNLLWDSSAGAFADARRGDELSTKHAVVSSSSALLADAATDDQAESAIASIHETLDGFVPLVDEPRTTPFGCFFLFGALYESGEGAYVEELIRQLYVDMVTDPTGTLWETFKETSSLTHAWSSAPTYYLSTRVLGVRLGFPDDTDLSTITIKPESETLAWARGTVSHPIGRVSVDWRVLGSHLVMTVTAPDGAPIEVEPQGRLAELTLDLTVGRR